jgi:hypothetical protein
MKKKLQVRDFMPSHVLLQNDINMQECEDYSCVLLSRTNMPVSVLGGVSVSEQWKQGSGLKDKFRNV